METCSIIATLGEAIVLLAGGERNSALALLRKLMARIP